MERDTAPSFFPNMKTTLYVATTNPGKLRDFSAAAKRYAASVLFESLPAIYQIAAPPEDAATFEANARAKAIYYSHRAPDLIVLADDSGLEVDALAGSPGVRSARYAADAGFLAASDTPADARNNLYLLENLRNVPAARRTARYRCVLAAAQDGACIAVGHGTVEGIILEAPRGSGGFGYDPLFYLSKLDLTMAEISLDQKNELSHRGHALRALLAHRSFSLQSFTTEL